MAAETGLSSGQALADARALRPDLMTVPDEPGRTETVLRGLVRWAQRYSPRTARDGTDGVLLDTTGCAHLFGGEAALLDDIVARLADLGLTARTGLADTRGAAWALARFAHPEPGEHSIAPSGRTRATLEDFPVAALNLEADTVATLMRLGLRRIGQVSVMPRAGLARRFGRGLVDRIDRVMGVEPDPIPHMATPAPYAVRLSLPEPIGRTDDVMSGLGRLLDRLCARLEREQRGARAMTFTVRRVDRAAETLRVVLARPGRDKAAISRLFEDRINKLDAGFGIDVLRLEATQTEALHAEQGRLDKNTQQSDTLDMLVANLSNRYGFDRVIRYLPADSHVPERAFTTASALYSNPESFPDTPAPRPLTLFPPEAISVDQEGIPPACFRWRRMRLETECAIGPERIAPEWWWDDPAWRSGTRDYWWVQTAQGSRLWLFRTPQQARGWYVHGQFA